MWFSNANTIAASLCECSENDLENENIRNNWTPATKQWLSSWGANS